MSEADEAFYAESGREMLASGDYLTPHFNFEPRFQKPILFYWVVAGFYHLLGVTPFAARLGSALAGVGLALVAFGLGRRWYGDRVGLLAGAIVATSFGCAAMARASLPDMPLAFFVTAAIASGIVPLLERVPKPGRWWILASACAALAFLTKGPVGVAIIGLVLGVAMIAIPHARRPRLGTMAIALFVFLLIAAPWYAAMAVEHGLPYLEGFFVGDNIERFATTRYNQPRALTFYLPIVAGGLLPWSPFLLLVVEPAWAVLRRRARASGQSVALAIWVLAPLVLLTASVGKQPRYVLPLLPPLAVIVARALVRATAPERSVRARWLTAGGWIAGLSMASLGVLIYRADRLLAASGAGSTVPASLVVGAGGVAVLVATLWRRARWLPPTLAVASTAAILSVQFGVVTPESRDPVVEMARQVGVQRTLGQGIGTYGLFTRNLVFYTHVRQEDLYSPERLAAWLDAPDPVLCVMSEHDVLRLAGEGRNLRTLATLRFFDPSTVRPWMLLEPDLDKVLKAAVLVSTK